MRWYEAVFLGILQGLSEFLPISSSGHLALAQELFGVGLDTSERLGFGVLLHLATLISVIWVYRADVLGLASGAWTLILKLFSGKIFKEKLGFYERLALCTAISTLVLIPAALLDSLLASLSSSMLVIGVCLVLNSIILWFSDALGRQSKDLEKLSPKNAFAVGFCQLLALLPGISRSGATVTGMLSQDFDRQSAVKYSFIMSVPTILGASVLELDSLFVNTHSKKELMIFMLGAVFAAITAVISMKLLTYISKKSNFRAFSYYCAVLGIAVILRETL